MSDLDQSPTNSAAPDDAFEHMARGAGAALRRPASSDTLDQIVRRGTRRQATTRLSVTGVAVVVAITGWFVLWNRDRADDPAPSVTTTPAPAAPWLAYTRSQPDGYGIRLIHPDGTGDRPALIGVPAGIAEHPDWSPDGHQMVFTVTESAGDDSRDLWVGDIPGAAHRLVDCSAPCRWVDEAAWSPDGTRIAFQRGEDVDGRLVSTLEVIDLRTSIHTVLLTAPSTTVYLAPRWGPDGHRLVVETARIPEDTVAADPDGDGVGVVDLDHLDAGVRMLTDLEHSAQNPDWNWATDRISYAARSVEGASETDVFTIAPDGSDRVQVTHVAATHGVARFPTFTPDGRRIVFAFLADGSTSHSYKLASVAVDGSNLRTAVGTDFIVGEQPRMQTVSP